MAQTLGEEEAAAPKQASNQEMAVISFDDSSSQLATGSEPQTVNGQVVRPSIEDPEYKR